MRMTNKIMQNNSLYNINNNKVLQDMLSTQMSTQKKITRPSDDPVIAIRALRLRSDVSTISQYHEKNAPDAESWLKVTGDALNTTSEVLKDMKKQCTKGSVKDATVEDLDIIVTQLAALRDEFYSTGNVDYAGRYVFTGYRTDTTLTYTEDTTQHFAITEQLNSGAIDTVNYTDIGSLKGLTKENYDPTTDVIGENEVVPGDIYRIRLSYDKLSDAAAAKPVIEQVTDPTTVPPTTAQLIAPGDIVMANDPAVTDAPPAGFDGDYYEFSRNNPGKAVFVPETGELLIGDTMYNNTFKNMDADREIRVTYEKNDWAKGDLRPQHYFACEDKGTHVKYNYAKNEAVNPPAEYIAGGDKGQVIEYNVGYNQTIRVNTTADEVYTTDIKRDVDDLESALNALKEIDEVRNNLDAMLKNAAEGTAEYDNIKASWEAADKAYTYIRENMQKKFEGMITKVGNAMDCTSVAITDNGTRSSRLDLISDRLMTQKTTFQTLQSENEDADMTEVAIKLTSMEYSYNSALMATGKIMQTSLMNYI